MDRQIYIDCARSMKQKICNEINGRVQFEIYPEMDAITFKFIFKDFDFNYGINNIQDLMISDRTSEAVDEMLRKYRKAILNGFFKTKERKEKDKMEALGYENF